MPKLIGDSGQLNELNNDNVIFKSNTWFVYDIYASKNGKPVYILQGDGPRNYVVSNKKNKECLKRIYLFVYPNTSEKISLSSTQTLISYKHQFGKTVLEFSEITGIIENKNYIFLHPPRAWLDIVEFAPFPELPQNFKEKKEWETHGGIGGFDTSPWGIEADSLRAYHTKTYTLESDSIPYRIEGKQILCSKINGTFFSPNNVAVSSSSFLFNPEYGFVKISIQGLNGYLIELNLTERIFSN
ncbi:MAG: hypothetical protein R2792_02555 [Saprospiraceae bacterium]